MVSVSVLPEKILSPGSGFESGFTVSAVDAVISVVDLVLFVVAKKKAGIRPLFSLYITYFHRDIRLCRREA